MLNQLQKRLMENFVIQMNIINLNEILKYIKNFMNRIYKNMKNI